MNARRTLAHVTSLALACQLGACIPAYHPPTLSEPHALLKVRRTYDTLAGTHLRESLLVDGHDALQANVAASLASAPRIDSTLVHPTPATFAMTGSFFHSEYRPVQEQYYEQEPYSTYESYDCSSGYGTNAVHRTCSRNVTQYRSVTRYRTVYRWVEVVDAQCRAERRFAPAVGRVYLLQYSFQENLACALSCFEQLPESDGTFRNLPCPAAPPPQ
jgi:hypothetical protein